MLRRHLAGCLHRDRLLVEPVAANSKPLRTTGGEGVPEVTSLSMTTSSSAVLQQATPEDGD